MPRSEEWIEFHLTQNGWVEGSELMDIAGLRQREVPQDRVLTLRFYTRALESSSGPQKWYIETWSHHDKNTVDELVKKHGKKPSSRGSSFVRREDAGVQESTETREAK